MKLLTNFSLMAVLMLSMTFYGCNKKDDATSSEDTQYIEHSNDEAVSSNEQDQALSDADAVLNASLRLLAHAQRENCVEQV